MISPHLVARIKIARMKEYSKAFLVLKQYLLFFLITKNILQFAYIDDFFISITQP